MQLIDELSMIYATCLFLYAVFSHGRSAKTALIVGVSVAALAAAITAYYHYLPCIPSERVCGTYYSCCAPEHVCNGKIPSAVAASCRLKS